MRNLIIPIIMLLSLLHIPHALAQGVLDEKTKLAGLQAIEQAERDHWRAALDIVGRSNHALLQHFMHWRYALNKNSGADFAEIATFILAQPHWPEQDALRVRAESAMLDDDPPPDQVLTFFQARPPLTGRGKLAKAMALGKNHPQTIQLIKEAWVQGDFTADHELMIRTQYGHLLDATDHLARIEHLLWDDKTNAAERMLSLTPKTTHAMYKARIALIRNKSNVDGLINQLSSGQRANAGIVFDRMRWRHKRGLRSGAESMLLQQKSAPPNPKKWWKYRVLYARDAIEDGEYRKALQFLQHHGLSEGWEYADALWLQGWVELSFMNQADEAYKKFFTLYKNVSTPISRARGAYWAGRAAEANGNPTIAQGWYRQAAQYGVTYYGQLAMRKLGITQLSLPDQPSATQSERNQFANSELAQLYRMLLQLDYDQTALEVLTHMAEHAKSEKERLLVAELGHAASQPHHGVRASKEALHENQVLLKTGWPTITLPENISLKPELAFAIARQESEFNPKAESHAGARGMMQLMPATARKVARDINFRYSRSKLFDPRYNIVLGSSYLQERIDAYDGSYILAIASYNAGPGNVRSWIKRFGSPPATLEARLDWLETIPFSETRNYVQRVLENRTVYRAMLGDNTLDINEAILR